MNDQCQIETIEVARDKLRLLEYLLAEEGIGDSEAKRIEPRGEVCDIPLSFAQQRLWFLDQMGSDRAVYNIPEAYYLTGPLNLAAFQCAINEIICRHEVLRTTFRAQEGQPFQVVSSHEPLEIPVTDLSKMAAQEKEATVRRLAAENAEYPFDLTHGPLLRASLLRLDEEQHTLLLCMHHIVSDGWSMSLLFQELAVLYEAFSTGKLSPLAKLPIQYADFAIWQRKWLRDDVLQRQLDYWKQKLGRLTPELTLSTDRQRPPIQTHRGSSHSFVIPKIVTGNLNALARSEGVTLFMLLLAAFKVLLYRQSGQENIAVGSPIANRTQTETEGLIGFFVNTLVLQSDLSGNPSFRELLAQVRETAFDAYTHQDLPFEKLVEELQPARSLSHSPLFQVMFMLQNAPAASLRLGDLTVAPLQPTDNHTAKFDLTLTVTESKQELKASIVYNSDLFEATTAVRLGDHFSTLLQSIVEDPAQPIATLGLMTDVEQHQMLVEWNDNRVPYPKDETIHELFEAQVKRRPEAVAVIDGNRQLTYQELNRKANQLGHYLRKRGVGPDVLVGISMNRCEEMVVGVLGILKAGGAYVPLDPTYPSKRLRYMIEDAGIAALLTQEELLERISDSTPGDSLDTLCLDRDSYLVGRESEENPQHEGTAENLAYVMYTSGSTGQPKGVGIPQQAVSRLVLGTDYAQFGENEVFLQMAPTSFDASTFELWGALLHGARCVLYPGRAPSPSELGQLIERRGVTTLWLTASLFNALIDDVPEILRPLRRLLIGGEALSVAHVRRANELLPDTQIINGYGPTENTTFTCCHPIPRQVDPDRSIPIGKGIANTQVYLLDKFLNPVPLGAVGELYAGGEGLARGYWKRSDLTAERFVPNPFARTAGERLYRTGDLARFRADGNIEFMGRVDSQVKIRGFRIELGEIEAVLCQHPSVEQAVVICQEELGERRLVAYFTASKGGMPSAALRSFMKDRVPDYMMPGVFVRLDRLPLTANGKVDRHALPQPVLSETAGSRSYCPPRDRLELQLARIWESLLQVERVSIQDNFFELGGHSLLAVKLLAHINQGLGRELPLVSVFQASTVEQMASLIKLRGWTPPGESLVVVQPNGRKPPFFCVHGYAGYPGLAAHFGREQPVYGLVQGLEGNRFHVHIEDLARHYLRDVKAICPRGPYFLGGHSFGGLVAFEMASQLRRAGEEVGLLVLIDPTTPTQGSSKRHSHCPTTGLDSPMPGHWRQLQALPWRRKPAFFVERCSQTLTLLRKNAKRLACEACLQLGRSIPPSLRAFYISEILFGHRYPAAARAYQPQPCDCRAVLFQADWEGKCDPAVVWRELISRELTSYTVPGKHLEILKEPRIGVVADHLKNCLTQAMQEAGCRPSTNFKQETHPKTP